MDDKRLFLIDGHSLLYRSYYAIRSLSNSKGFPTNAIYGFINTLRKLINEEKPCYLGIVFDTGKPTLRAAPRWRACGSATQDAGPGSSRT